MASVMLDKKRPWCGEDDECGVAIGAVVVHPRHLKLLLDAAREAGFARGGLLGVTPYRNREEAGEDSLGGPFKAFHVTPEGAMAIDAFMKHVDKDASADVFCVPKVLAEMLLDGTAKWIPGVRIYSDECLGPVGPFTGVKRHRRAAGSVVVERCTDRIGDCAQADRKPALFTYAELFAGIGGFRVALDKLGGRCVFASELDDQARETYAANFGSGELYGDITMITTDQIPAHDILTAGFPCQPFSKAGPQQGLNDRRGSLFLEVVRVLAAKRPRIFVLENVENFVNIDGGDTFAEVMSRLSTVGYQVSHSVIDAAALVPQRRRRVYIVGFLQDADSGLSSAPAGRGMVWPEIADLHPKVADILESDTTVGESYSLSQQQWNKISSSQYHLTLEKGPGWRLVREGGTARTLMSSYKQSPQMYSEFVGRCSCAGDREWEGDGCGAPGCHSGKLPRFFTPKECARLQGFPDDFVVDACRDPNRFYHQIGNAVCPPVVYEITRAALQAAGFDLKQA